MNRLAHVTMHAVALILAPVLAPACTSVDAVTTGEIVGGSIDRSHDATVVVLGPPGQCSGTLIAARADGTGAVLTAAHCTDAASPPSAYNVIIADDYAAPDRVFLNVTSVRRHPGFTGGLLSGDDVAVLLVSGIPVGASTLAPLRASEDRLAPGAGYLSIGYGTTNPEGTARTTVRHAAMVRVDSIAHNRIFSVWGDGAICGGDSGGSLVREIGGELRLVGVHGISNGDCDMEVTMGSDRVSYYEDFVTSVVENRAPGCSTCRQAAGATCRTAHTECGANEDCSDYRRCLEECLDLDAPCTNACLRREPAGAARYAATVGACVCGDPCGGVCADACTGPLVGLAAPEPDAGRPDAGALDAGSASLTDASLADAAIAVDAGLPREAGVIASPSSSCGCAVAAPDRRIAMSIAIASWFGLLVVRRRRRSRITT